MKYRHTENPGVPCMLVFKDRGLAARADPNLTAPLTFGMVVPRWSGEASRL